MKINSVVSVLLLTLLFMSCSTFKKTNNISNVLYKTEDLIVTQVTKNTFEHTSFLHTKDYGIVPGNGLMVRDNKEVIIFDTPADDKSAEELIHWVENSLHCKIIAVIPTHFHPDCLGGLKAFQDKGIPSYSYFKTIEFAKESNFVVPETGFKDSLILKVGNQKIIAQYFGEGHTKDNIVGYFPNENVLFGGCLIKEMNASKGYLHDANVNDWSATVEKVKKEYPHVKVVVPGHGKFGNEKLLDYTIELFKTK
ncbi:MAG: subclass B1 metallo-beta-lactamase [Bacteroidetes bacterium]|nr:subclass B1 metallo-beta-lactamase [Bacteroidota bacterium]